MPSTSSVSAAPAWRLQDAKAQFSALVDSALRGVPQHVTRRGRRAVVVLSEQDFAALQRSAVNPARKSVSFVEHLLAMPKEPVEVVAPLPVKVPVQPAVARLSQDLLPRDIDFS